MIQWSHYFGVEHDECFSIYIETVTKPTKQATATGSVWNWIKNSSNVKSCIFKLTIHLFVLAVGYSN